MKKSLLKEVSLSELQSMRAQGLSNKEIAQRLDCSTHTIYAYLGKMPTELRSEIGRRTERNRKECYK